ncbi:hypothetical protein B0H14DRAFT_2547883 [Mycena olivaceomarginata]|nr:hypothetical protein B0H14DRAFT_2547883 [Mycena olivaceomarginata]
MKITKGVIEYVVGCVSETVDFAMGRTPAPSLAPASPTSSSSNSQGSPYHTKFTAFVTTVLFRAKVAAPTVLTSLVYIIRARPHLSIPGEEWALERVFLGALIVASKYTNDRTLKNARWALCTGVFGKRDVGRIEREFLDVLDWELGIRQGDLLAHHEGLVAATSLSPSVTSTYFSSAAPTRTATLAAARPCAQTDTHVCRPSTDVVPVLEPSSPQSGLSTMSTPAPLPYKLSSASSYNLNPRTTPSPSTTSVPAPLLFPHC